MIAIENVRLFEEVQARNREVSEALEQQTATSAILRVIAASPTDIQPVLQVVVESATRFCDTYDAVVCLAAGDLLVVRAHHGPIWLDFQPLPINRDTVTGRAYVDRETQHVHDLQAAGEEFPLGQESARRAGHRTIAAVPLMREGEAIGSLVIRRNEVRPFSDKQIELLKTFADQAAIAIQNVRLFEEVQAKTRDLEESLTFQKATSDVLEVIGKSASTLQPVLDVIVETAAELCAADMSVMRLMKDGDASRRIRQSQRPCGPGLRKGPPDRTESTARRWLAGSSSRDTPSTSPISGGCGVHLSVRSAIP